MYMYFVVRTGVHFVCLVFLQAMDEWVEFVRVWEVREEVEALVREWLHVASYQKQLSSVSESLDIGPSTGMIVT